ncbi:MAG: Gfo/Idh/MocA family oxidoreductase [Acidobacteriota bacterium]
MVGLGLCGTGMIGKVHAEAIAAIPGAHLAAVCGRDPERTRAFAGKYGAEPYTNFSQMLAREDVSIINICTPSGTHSKFGTLAARAGKHVLVEKPIEISLKRADELIATCKQNGVQLGVIFQSRFLAGVQRLKHAIDAGQLGRLMLGDAYVKWYRAPEYYGSESWHGTLELDGGGALINQAIHTVDLLRWMMGPVETVFAFKGALRYPHLEGEDTLVASLRFRNGALGVIEAATSVAPGFKRRLEISGEHGTVILDGDEISVWKVALSDEVAGPGTEHMTDGSSNPAGISMEGHRRQIADMIEAVGQNRTPVVSGREARDALEVVEAIYTSTREKRAVDL